MLSVVYLDIISKREITCLFIKPSRIFMARRGIGPNIWYGRPSSPDETEIRLGELSYARFALKLVKERTRLKLWTGRR